MTVKDKGEYLRGLLVLCRLDQEVSLDEKNFLKKLSKILGYDPSFGRQAVDEIQENSYIAENPPRFSMIKIGYSFINDSIHLAYLDHDFHPNEIRWIRNAAQINGIEKKYWLTQIAEYKNDISHDLSNSSFALEKLLLEEHLFPQTQLVIG